MNGFLNCVVLFLSHGLFTSGCPTGWLAFDDRCFLPVLNETLCATARIGCVHQRAQLADASGWKQTLLYPSIADSYNKNFRVDANDFRPLNSLSSPCVVAESSGMTNDTLDKPFGYICQSLLTERVPDCLSLYNGTYVMSSCVFVRHENIQRTDAGGVCSRFGGQLLDVTHKFKASLARAFATYYMRSFWVGNTPQEEIECMMVGRNAENETEFKWSTSGCANVTADVICEVSGDQVPATTTSQPPTTTRIPPLLCPGGNWRSRDNMCYWETTYETERMNWNEARRFCQGYGGDLASYSNKEEELFALHGAAHMRRGLWIGLQRVGDSKEFQWADGSSLNYTNWSEGEPQHLPHLNCGAHSGPSSQWVASYCGARRWFACKVPKVRSPKLPTEDPEVKLIPKCQFNEGTWYRQGDNCYMLELWKAYSWKSAQTLCEDYSSTLVSIHSYNETDFLLRLLDSYGVDDYWIGLQSSGFGSAFSWSDDTSLEFFNWGPGVDLNSNSPIRCATFNSLSGFWHIAHCNLQLPFVCKRKINGTAALYRSTTPAPIKGFCPDMWYVFGDKCYKPFGFNLSEKVPWKEANRRCSVLGGSLAIIHSEEEQDFLVDLVLQIGYETWIGMKLNTIESVFEWLDASLIDYVNWNVGEPYRFGAKEDCIEMLFGSSSSEMGKWNDIGCNKSKGYICQRNKDPTLKEPGKDPSFCKEMKGWAKLSTSCFMLFREPKPWLEAQFHCRRHNATLAAVDNFAGSLFLKQLAAGADRDRFWIGIRETEKDVYKSFAPYPLSYTNWPSGQPRRVSSLSNCVAVDKLSHWYVTECSTALPFFCQLQTDHTNQSPTLEEGICPNGSYWHNVKGPSCYLFDISERLTGHAAARKCFNYGGSLASFHSLQQLNAIAPFIKGAELPLFIGLAKKHDGSYSWFDGSPVDFTNWESGEPNSEEEYCVEMHTDVLTWNDISCEQSRGFVCSASKIPLNNAKRSKKAENHRKSAEKHLAVTGIVGIIVCSMVVMAIAAAFFYYTCPKTSMRTRPEPETPLYERTTSNEALSFE